MQHVKQKHTLGCGPACAAMVSGQTYEKAIKAIHPRRKKGSSVNTPAKKLISGLFRLGMSAHRRYVEWSDILKLKTPAIVNIQWYANNPNMRHWIVYDPQERRFIDPYPFSKKRLKVYENSFNRGCHLIVVVGRRKK